MRVLVSDIGGTHARLAIVQMAERVPRIVLERDYVTPQYPGLDAVLDLFLGEVRRELGAAGDFDQAAFAVAGPVAADSARITNVPAWRVDRIPLQARLGVRCRLLNDFEAAAYGAIATGPEGRIVLQAGVPDAQGALAFLGPGTGLGVAGAAWNGGRHRPFSTEAGHLGFAPRDESQIAVWRHLKARRGQVCWEHVVSGPGLAAIHECLRAAEPGPRGEPLSDPAAISAQGLADPRSLAGRALDVFVACFGAFAGEVALALMARGGVTLCGHIATTLSSRLAQGDFLAAFQGQGSHRDLLRSLPVSIVPHAKLGLLGAAHSVAGA